MVEEYEHFTAIDLRSDTLTRPSRGMREAIISARVGDDVFGEDPTVNRLQSMAADMFGKEDALFVPSGTMANEIAINVHTNPGDEIIIDSLSHIINFETGAPALLSGVNLIALEGKNGIMTAEQIDQAIRPEGIQFARTGLVCLENTHNYAGGSIYPIDEIRSISALVASRGIPTHLDGARIFNAAVATGIEVEEYALYFDSVSFCVSKGLGAPVGSLLLGNKKFIEEARRVRKIFGGAMRQAGIIAAAGIYALENNIARLAKDHENAKMLAETLNATTTFEVDPKSVQTNIVLFRIAKKRMTPAEAAAALDAKGIKVFPFGENQLRAVTHLNLSRADIEDASRRLKEYF